MLKQTALIAFLFTAASRAECSNQSRDDCDDGEPIGPDTVPEQPLAVSPVEDGHLLGNGFDDKGTYPLTKDKCGTVCKDENMGGTCKTIWTGSTNVVPNGWNDDVSSTYVKSHYRCAFYCDGYGGRYMTTVSGPKTVNWINSWNDCISSWRCERTCMTKQTHCKTNTAGCYTDKYIKCKTCDTGYILNSYGGCDVDNTCIAVKLTIETVELSTESLGVPDEMVLGDLSVDNCNNDQTHTSMVSDSETVSHTVDTSYVLSKSYASTMGESMSASVTLTVKGEIVPGFGADVSTSLSSTSSFSQTQSSSSSSTDRTVDVTTNVWTHSETIYTSPYHNSTYSSIGQSTPGKIQWTGTMECYNKLNQLTKSKSVTGTYSGANIHSYNVELVSKPCGAPAGFELESDKQCMENEIDTGSESYSTLIDAQNACQKRGKDCYGVMDINCDGVLDYYLCANNGTPLEDSKAGTCVYQQVQEESSKLASRLSAAESQMA